jgi:hypothetical protein
MSVDRPIAREDIMVLLSSALGEEKSEEVIVSAAREAGLSPSTSYSADELRAIFARLAALEGLVGVVARFAISRGDVEKLAARSRPADETRASEPRPEVVVDLIPLLAPSIGVEKARETIEGAAARLGIDAGSLTPDHALAVLHLLAEADGIIGVVARFAKARFLLRA